MIHYIPLDFVLKLHDELIDRHGGVKGILSLSLLQSALEMPRASYQGQDLHKTVFDKAAAYLFHITKNHPFVDGNKRTASMLSMLFLVDNDIPFLIDEAEYEKLVLNVATSLVTKSEIAKFFKKAGVAVKKRNK